MKWDVPHPVKDALLSAEDPPMSSGTLVYRLSASGIVHLLLAITMAQKLGHIGFCPVNNTQPDSTHRLNPSPAALLVLEVTGPCGQSEPCVYSGLLHLTLVIIPSGFKLFSDSTHTFALSSGFYSSEHTNSWRSTGVTLGPSLLRQFS